MHPAMDQRDWERRARSKHRAGPRARGPWRHPHALWLAVIVAVVVLLQGATYARIHARSSRIQSADEEIARRAEAIRAMLVKQEDLREQVAQLREVVVRMDAAVVDTLERGAAARKSNAKPTAATTTPTLASDPSSSSSSSVASLRERQRILMDRAALANRLAGVAPTDADEAFFDANDAALREMREERAAYARREAAEAAAGKMVWSKSVNDAMASPKTGGSRARAAKRASSSSTWDDEDRVVRKRPGRRRFGRRRSRRRRRVRSRAQVALRLLPRQVRSRRVVPHAVGVQGWAAE